MNNNEENILDKNSVIEIFYDDGGAMYKVDRPHLDFPNGYNLIYNDKLKILSWNYLRAISLLWEIKEYIQRHM